MVTSKKRKLPMEQQQSSKKKRQTKTVVLEEAPPVNSIADLISLSKSTKFYKNIDNVMLWRVTPHLEELQNMIGMQSVKESVFYQVIYYLQGMHSNNNEEYLHTVIYGPPGSGKTTVAKIIGKIYHSMSILSSNGTFKIGCRDDFLSGYLGQTAIKTKKFLKSCLGGVLFIDEVYSLGPRDNDRDSFAKEAIDTINGFLSEHKNEFCCIIAGYENDVNSCFFGMNQGLTRRFPWVHRILPYTTDDYYNIFCKMIRESKWLIDVEKSKIVSLFNHHKDLFKNAGGDVETFFSKCKMMHSKRVFTMDKKQKFILIEEDLNSAIDYVSNMAKKKDDRPPLSMYM